MQKALSEKVATLGDVAARAGVGRAAVSAALNGSQNGTRVSEPTRQRILQAVTDLQYRPNSVARSLRRRTSNILGFYSGEWSRYLRKPFFAEVVSGLEAACEAHHKDLLIHATFRGRHTDEIYAELVNGHISGLILFAPEDDTLKLRLAESRLPVVAIANPVPTLPSVVVNDAEGSRLIARHLFAKGHRRVFYVYPSYPLALSVRRRDAFLAEAAALGITVTEVSDPNTAEGFLHFLKVEVTPALSSPQRPTAAVCWYDDAAQQLLAACLHRGLRVPEDLAVVGFDGVSPLIPPARYLTSVQASWGNVAQEAVVSLVHLLEGKEVPGETMLPVALFIGDTT